MKEHKIYAGATVIHKKNKKFGGVIFSFNPKEIMGKHYTIEEEDYKSKVLSEILNDVFVHEIKDFQIYRKHIMEKLRLSQEQKEANKNETNN